MTLHNLGRPPQRPEIWLISDPSPWGDALRTTLGLARATRWLLSLAIVLAALDLWLPPGPARGAPAMAMLVPASLLAGCLGGALPGIAASATLVFAAWRFSPGWTQTEAAVTVLAAIVAVATAIGLRQFLGRRVRHTTDD